MMFITFIDVDKNGKIMIVKDENKNRLLNATLNLEYQVPNLQ